MKVSGQLSRFTRLPTSPPNSSLSRLCQFPDNPIKYSDEYLNIFPSSLSFWRYCESCLVLLPFQFEFPKCQVTHARARCRCLLWNSLEVSWCIRGGLCKTDKVKIRGPLSYLAFKRSLLEYYRSHGFPLALRSEGESEYLWSSGQRETHRIFS